MRKMTEEQFRKYSTTGNLYMIIMRVGTPLAIFALFNSLFSLLDTMMASHIGTIAVSTVAYINQLRMILNSVGSGLITGAMILINRAFGADDREKAGALLCRLVRLIIITSALFLLLIPFIPQILRLIATPEEFIDEGSEYFAVMIAATIVNFINLVYINVEKTRGGTGIIMVLNIVTMMLKLLLTALFIYVLEGGIIFIALATLITQSLFAVYSAVRLGDRNSIFTVSVKGILRREKGLGRKIIGIAYPVTVEDAAFSLGKTVVNSMASVYGAEIIGALGISNNVCGIATNLENGYSDSSSAIVSQNIGAGKYIRAVDAYRANIVITFIVSLISAAVLWIFQNPLISIFATSRTGIDMEFMSTIKGIFIYDLLGCLALSLNGAGMDFLLGMGKTKITLVLNFCRIFLLRIPVLYVLQRIISDGDTVLGLMMMISNCSIALLTTAVCIREAGKLREIE